MYRSTHTEYDSRTLFVPSHLEVVFSVGTVSAICRFMLEMMSMSPYLYDVAGHIMNN